MAALGVALNVLPRYRNLLGVVETASGLLVKIGPGALCTALHAACARQAKSRVRASSRVPLLCGAFDMLVGALAFVPWAGPWFTLLSPFSFVAFLAFYTPRSMVLPAFIAANVATLSIGVWITVQAVAPSAADSA
jgi:hypothetical protein